MQENLSAIFSPLSEAEPLSLDELFARAIKSVQDNDLLNSVIVELGDREFSDLVAFYRAEAIQHAKREAAGERPVKSKITKKDLRSTTTESSLDDLL